MTVDERIEALTARHEALTARHEALTMNVEMMQAAQAEIHNTHDEMQKDFNLLLRSQVLISESLDTLAIRMKELAEAPRLTEEQARQPEQRLDALILTVD